ncbi:hypothetical protein [Georgenia sp. SYP-B2076]|uniref:hypothetical protein n=1 Tax=Georgenia sp. SYP-B2076 TaxID=2495881 RepID=UPI000F8CBA66|nr:hypothetical protein [Georgenia sp. SYP-B2076]
MSVVPIPPHTRWVGDPRGGGRGLRVSSHAAAGVLVLSVWRADECVATVRLRPDEAAALVSGVVEGLADLTQGTTATRDVS